ncbi:hypothetical protein LTR62_005246 [Meristemomyces frigidus]|uniref:THO complex subunit 2 n=1 Tax=Meristemomyces frigidus TaxID=1508187 RepID=A0AAN7TEQ9_9PEZI|nr:hypothetical protein LTR62_005246 [Meristemomyces frigidus]
MPPGSANKRKRPENDAGRPSPHRPENLSMAQRMGNGNDGGRGRGGRRQASRGGPSSDSPNAVPVAPRNAQSPAPPRVSTPQPAVGTPGPGISRTSTPLPPAATPAPPSKAEIPREPPAPYAYEFVTDEMVSSWQDSGRQSLLDAANSADELGMNTLLQELVRSGLDGRLDAGEAGLVVKELALQQKEGSYIQEVVLDIMSLLGEADMKSAELLTFLAETDIDPSIIRQYLDWPLLVTLNLVRSSFDRARTRKTTTLLYKQANFNLLREETEGYAKLLTEYFNIAEDSVKSTDPNVAENASQRIMALIGAFDLDVGRVLDITLDISANLLVKAYAFHIKFYRCSSWWPESNALNDIRWEDDGFNTFPPWAMRGSGRLAPSESEQTELAGSKQARDERFWERVRQKGLDAYFELGQKRIVDLDSVTEQLSEDVPVEVEGKAKDLMEAERRRLSENKKYMRETGMLPPPGNSDAAQILGFKLQYYTSPVRDGKDDVPDNLIHFAALLIKIGFISLRDLYPHLYPADEDMPKEKIRLEAEKKAAEQKATPGKAANALATASVLTDDTMPPPRAARDKDRSGAATPKPSDPKNEFAADALPPPSNQKVKLLKALLALGAIPEALYILGRFPWLVDADTTLPPFLLRIARHMLSHMAETTKPLAERRAIDEAREQLSDTTTKSDGTMTFTPRTTKLPTKHLGLEDVGDKDGMRYRYYYTEWADNVPVCRTLDDVFQLCDTFLGFLGLKIGRDTMVFGTLLRLARRSLTDDFSDANQARWLELMRRLLVPALSLSQQNPSLTEEVYQLLMLFPVTTRYNMYAEWFAGRTSRLSDMKTAFDYNKAEVKVVLGRVSNDNCKVQARALGKVAYSSPGIVVRNMIDRLQEYANMIPALVECTKYFPKLAYDVLIWCLINSLSGTGKDRIQADGMLTSPWLQALSKFVAALFSRYPGINPSPILQYVASELRNGDSTDLEVLDQILTVMAGIGSEVELSHEQVFAMAGGEALVAHTLQTLRDNRHTCKATAKKLIRALNEPGLTGQLLIAIAQERQMYAHHESSAYMPLKVLGNNLDKIQAVFAQYLDVLRTNLKPEEFDAIVPDVVTLIGEYGLQPCMAFMICRGSLIHRICEHDEAAYEAWKLALESRKKIASQEASQANGDVDMSEGKNLAAPTTVDEEAEVNNVPIENAGAEPETSKTASPSTNGSTTNRGPKWHPTLQPIIDGLPQVLNGLDNRVSIAFYVNFWSMALKDVYVPNDTYKVELDKVNDEIKVLLRERANKSSAGRLEIDRLRLEKQSKVEKFKSEPMQCMIVYHRINKRLEHREKQHWFDRSRRKEDLEKRHDGLLQECFLPRAMISKLDAQYSYFMLKTLHGRGTPGYSTMHILDRLFRKQALAAIIFQCTGQEARHFGHFLNEVLKLLKSWHAKREDFEKEALGGTRKLPGFVIGRMDYDASPDTWKFMDYEDFRRQVSDWHIALTNALDVCFKSGEYMHIRNGIMVLDAVVAAAGGSPSTFPQVSFMGKKLINATKELSEKDSRQDLKLMAMSVWGQLRKQESSWVMPQAFRLHEVKDTEKADSRATSAVPATAGTADKDAAKLNAAAADFKPKANGGAKEPGSAVEDGEVEEEKQAAADAVNTTMKDAPTETKVEVRATTLPGRPSAEPQVVPAPSPSQLPHKPAMPTGPAASRGQAAMNGSIGHEPTRGPQAPLPARPPQNAPSRPDSRAAYEHKPLPPTPVARPEDRRSTRGADDGYGRLDRPSETRPASREHSPGGGNSRARTPPGMQRSQNRDERPRASRNDSNSSRDGQRPPMHTRPTDIRDRERVNGSMGPPSTQHTPGPRTGHLGSVVSVSAGSTPSRAPAASPAAAPASDFQVPVNNERLRLIQQDQERQARSQEAQREQPRENGHERQRRDERDGRPYPPQHSEAARDQGRREQPTELTPSGPKNLKGRLSKDGHQDLSYGRLNQPQEVPSGPRPVNGQGGRGGRNFTAPPLHVDTRSNGPSMSSPAGNRPPESPAADRGHGRQPSHDRRNSGPQNNYLQAPPPTTPAAPSSNEASGVMVNPERFRLINESNEKQARAAQSLPTSAAPPLGPRGANNRGPNGAPAGPSPTTATPPSGPASTPRQPRDRQRGPINSINATLQGGNTAPSPRGPAAQDVSFRGASTRQGNLAISSTAVPSTQAIAPPLDMPRHNEHSLRQDNMTNRLDSRAEPRHDLLQGQRDSSTHDESRSRRLDGQERVRRDDRERGSRHPSRERRQDEESAGRPPHGQGLDDGRDQRGTPRDDRRPRDEQGRQSGRREGEDRRRESQMPSGPMNAPPPPQSDYSRAGNYGPQGPRRDASHDDGRHGGRNSGRAEEFRAGQPRREDERRDGGRGGAMMQQQQQQQQQGYPPQQQDQQHQYPDRKRRHEEQGAPVFDLKRRRSGR